MSETKLPGVERLLEELEEQGVLAERSMDGVFIARHECDLLTASMRRMRVREAFLTQHVVMSVGPDGERPRLTARVIRRSIRDLAARRTYLLGQLERGLHEGARGYTENELRAIDLALLLMESAADRSQRDGNDRASADLEVVVGRVRTSHARREAAPC